MEIKKCNCPYVICKNHGNCKACVVFSKANKSMVHCMEDISEELGAKYPINIPKTVIKSTFEEMSRESANMITEVIKNNPHALICLPAGATAIRTFEILVESLKSDDINIENIHFVALDEWLDLEDESENCKAFLKKHFYTPLDVDEKNITFFNTQAEDLESECKRIDEIIFAHGGIDCMLLGLGMNGHLGLNEPDNDFDSYSKIVELDSVTTSVGQKYFTDGMKLTRGITLGIRHMFECKKVILQVGTSKKADIVSKMYHSRPTIKIPGTVMKLLEHGVVILDKDAAKGINDLID